MKRNSIGGACALLTLVACSAQQHVAAEQASVANPRPSSTPAAALAPTPTASKSAPAATRTDFGKVGERAVSLYTLKNQHGLTAKLMTYGATLTELDLPDRNGHFTDVVLGFDSVDEYVKASPYFGATIGRVANRIEKAQFELAGKRYALAANDPPNHLHGGKRGWDKQIWDAELVPNATAVTFKYISLAGEEGYPGTVSVKVTYTLTDNDELRVEFEATTDATTIVNLAHHSYWNLAGQSSGTVLDQELTLHADRYTPGDPVPNGAIKPVQGTAFDFTSPKAIGKDLREAGGHPVGFDLNYVIDGDPKALRPMAKLKDPKSGRVLELSADQPGLQVYSGNFLDGTVKGKGGAAYPQYGALCLESQKFPNSVNVPAWRDSVVLEPGQTYTHTMVHAFRVE